MAQGVGGGSLANITKHLKTSIQKEDLIKHTQKTKPGNSVIETFKKMPEKDTKDMSDVMKGYGEKHEWK